MVIPFFRNWISQQKFPKQVHVISTAHHPPLIPRNNSRKHINLVEITTSWHWTSRIYWSPEVRYLIACSNFKL